MISLIIPTLGHHPSLQRLLQSIGTQKLSRQWEVLVIDNGLKHDTQELVESFGDLATYFRSYPKGVNRARNLGVNKSAGRLLLFLDDDCELPDPLFLQRHLQAHNDHPYMAAIGGPYRLRQANICSRAYHQIAEDWLNSQRIGATRTLSLLGGNVSIHRRVFDAGYRFDETLTYGGTETELFQRLVLDGWQLGYDAHLAIWHTPNMTLTNLCWKAFRQGQGARYREKRHGFSPQTEHVSAPERTAMNLLFQYFYDWGHTGWRAWLPSQQFKLARQTHAALKHWLQPAKQSLAKSLLKTSVSRTPARLQYIKTPPRELDTTL